MPELKAKLNIVRVREIADSIQYGHTASAISQKDGPRFLRITDIQNGTVDWNSVPSCNIVSEDVAKYRLSKGDLVFARTGATTGKSFLISDCPEAVFASYLIRVRASKDVDPRYLAFFFQSPDYWQQIEQGKRGIGQPNVNGKTLGEIQLPLRPLNEQQRIVAEIEKQFTRLDAGVASLKRVHTGLKSCRTSVLKAACEGRLSAIGSRNWKMTTIEDVCSTIYRYPTFYGIEHLSRGVPVIRGEHILFGGRISHDWSDYWFVSDEVSAKFPRTIVEAGDLVMSVRGSVGKIGIVDRELRGAQLSPNCIRLSPRRDVVDARWLFIYLTSAAGAASVKEQVNQTTIETIKASAFKKTSIPLPTFAEQQEIIGEVERRLTVIDELRAVVETNLERTSRFRKSVLQQAFSGGGKFFSHALPGSSKLGV